MRNPAPTRTKMFSLVTAAAVTVTGLLVPIVTATQAAAAPAPTAQRSATSVTADALPTVQINGVAWSQAIIGNTVFVGGQFTNARPAGSAAGVNTTNRSNLLSYNLTTGDLITTFNPFVNSQVHVVAGAPDGSRVYIGGDFTSVAGLARQKIAAVDPTTGKVVTSFAPVLNGRVKAILVTDNVVYVGGMFTTANGVERNRLAAFDLNGNLLNWAPSADYTVNALVMTPDKTRVVAGGGFATINGGSAYGMGAIDASTGALTPWLTTDVIRNAGTASAVTSLRTDGTDIYGSGYTFGGGGNFEGAFRADGNTGRLTWLEDCHGDTYDVYPGADTVYSVSHSHYCGNVNGFPQTDPWSFNYALAWTKSAVGTATGPDPFGYASFAGQPTPAMTSWFPRLTSGTFTGQAQAGWTIAGNSQYVVIGGEFPTANGKAQQGLVRFAVSSVAPNKIGPESDAGMKPSVISRPNGTARVAFRATFDRDDNVLTYKVFKNGNLTTPVYTTTASSTFWNEPSLGFIDTGLVVGRSYSYRVFAYDANGNSTSSASTAVTIANVPASSYVDRVKADGASFLWRLDETSGTTAYDSAAFTDGVINPGVTGGAAGALIGDTDTASTFDGTAGFVASPGAVTGPDTFTVQAWIRTTTTDGGRIIGFGGKNTGTSNNYDRMVYMTPSGQLTFGVYPNTVRTVTSPGSYNDGQWHQVTASLSSAGMVLYVDGRQVGARTDTTFGQSYTGYWRVGGDSTGGWPDARNFYFAGDIDEAAVYPTGLSRATVDAQWVASGRTSTIVPAPADAYGAAVFNDNPELFWRLGESSGTVAADRGPSGTSTGVYRNGVTLGAAGSNPASTDTAASFDGVDDFVASTGSYNNPSVYSLEAWFNTTSTSGGKIIGFGSSNTGSSGSYDRHVYLQGDGKVVFGTYTGQLNTAVSPDAYNNGRWHHVVASQGADGMKLYLDGVLVATNAQTAAEPYTGYWKVGGDNTWGSSPYLNGRIDEVAVYNTVLPAASVTNHYNLGTGVAPNAAPTAAFTTAGTGATVTLDAAGSTDSDGTVAGYAWDFGDGTTGTGVTTSHTYTTSGAKTITLTVTDNKGATNTTTRQFTANVNTAPTAAFTATPAELTLSVDGSASTDAQGPISSWSWNFGDGATATGVTASHVYATAGAKTVTLTVTDAGGLTNVSTQTITVSAPVPNQAPVAAFTATPAGLTVTVDGMGSSDPDGTVESYAWNFGDGATATTATADHTYTTAGAKTITLTVTDNRGGTATATRQVTVTAPPAANVAPTASFTTTVTGLTVAVNGSGSTDPDGSVATWMWNYGDATAGGTAGSGTGATTSYTFAAAGTYTVTLTVTDNGGLTATTTRQVTVTAPNTPTVLAADTFTRTTASRLGAAETGGTWTLSGNASLFKVTGSAATFAMNTAGAGPAAYLNSVSAGDVRATVDVSMDKVPSAGGTYASLAVRRVGTSDYRVKVRFLPTGTAVSLVKLVNGVETAVATTNVSALRYAVGDVMRISLQAASNGAGATTLSAKVWKTSTTEPTAWQVTATDSQAALQAPGGVGFQAYLSGSATNAPVVATVDNLTVTTIPQ